MVRAGVREGLNLAGEGGGGRGQLGSSLFSAPTQLGVQRRPSGNPGFVLVIPTWGTLESWRW